MVVQYFGVALVGLAFLTYCSCIPLSDGGLGPACLQVNTTTHRLVDGLQRERYFHGVNVVVKGPPWMPNMTGPFDPFWSFVEEDMQLLYDNGLNGLRYGMMWPGVEPQQGVYDMKYIEAAVNMVNEAGKKYGIYTLLDMHQDILSKKFCGEGIPDWAVHTGDAKGFPFPLGEPYKYDPKTGYPTPEDCAKHSWFLYQFTEASSAAYQSLYDNVNGIRDSCANYLALVAESFADNPYIIGYDIFNEPWAGDVFRDPTLLVPKVADRKNLAGFYEVINTQVRKKDNCHCFFFESVTWDETEVGFEQVPGGSSYANRSVISFHFYDPPELSRKLEFSARQRDAKRLQSASFLSEFFINDEETMNFADEYLQSWLGWDYKGYVTITGSGNELWFNNGTKNEAAFDVMSRTYAQIVSGITTKMNFDPKTKEFILQYSTTSVCMNDTTKIYLNEKRHYSHGYAVSLQSNPSVSGIKWNSPVKNFILVVHDLTTVPEHTQITVRITKK